MLPHLIKRTKLDQFLRLCVKCHKKNLPSLLLFICYNSTAPRGLSIFIIKVICFGKEEPSGHCHRNKATTSTCEQAQKVGTFYMRVEGGTAMQATAQHRAIISTFV